MIFLIINYKGKHSKTCSFLYPYSRPFKKERRGIVLLRLVPQDNETHQIMIHLGNFPRLELKLILFYAFVILKNAEENYAVSD